ncbi:sam [Symbiodinium necroappetens]|uniref:Sam protein n=1 Tax=Symbiodinium necroappetens TaxID=1628268 RepID=A0A813AKD0_9DINO|nr:sam [Symbiodinium necroappetens]
MVKRLLRLYDQEGLRLFSWRKLHCLSAMEFALRRGDVPMAVQWARKAHENARLAHGPDHRDTRWCAELMKDPSSHPSFEYRSQELGSLRSRPHAFPGCLHGLVRLTSNEPVELEQYGPIQ